MDLLCHLIENCYAAQKRTGKSKQFVFYEGDKVYKGPYSADKMKIILARSKQMSIWNTPLVVLPVGTQDDFIIYPNIAEDYEIESYELNKESFSEYSYKVADRVGVDKMNYVLLENEWIYESADVIEALVHLWILDVGDTGIFNMLVDIEEHVVYVIDYDETATELRMDEMFYFSKHPAKKFKWYERMRCHYKTVAMRLMKIEYEDTERVNLAIKLLLKYSDLTLNSKLETGLSAEELEGIEHGKEISDRSFDIGKMEWHGPMGGTITYSGYRLDEVRSGLQKYIRRGMLDKALQCAFEMYRLMEVSDNMGVITNLYNRLKIIAVEDISLAGYNTVIEVLHLVNEEYREPEVLAAIVESLVRSKKTRICSHANAVYRNPIGRRYSRKKGLNIDRRVKDRSYISQYENEYPFCEIIDEYTRECAIMLHKRLSEGDFNVISWFYLYEKNMPEKIKLRYAYKGKRTANPLVHIFEVLELFGNTEAMEIIRKAYFTIGSTKRDDKKYFIIFAILSTMYELEYKEKTLGYTVNIENLLKGKYELVLDEYVYDKHTARGSHKGRRVFVTEGAYVENEDMKYHIEDLVEIYMNYI